MSKRFPVIVAAAFVLAAPMGPGLRPAAAAEPAAPSDTFNRPQVEQSYGCALLGGTATLIAVAMAPGAVFAAPLLAGALGGVTFGGFCVAGAGVTPATLDLAERLEAPATRLANATAALLVSAAELEAVIADKAIELIDRHVVQPAVRIGTATADVASGTCHASAHCTWVIGKVRAVTGAEPAAPPIPAVAPHSVPVAPMLAPPPVASPPAAPRPSSERRDPATDMRPTLSAVRAAPPM